MVIVSMLPSDPPFQVQYDDIRRFLEGSEDQGFPPQPAL